MQRLNATDGQLDALFESPTLNSFVRAALDLPEVVAELVNSFFDERLHRFLAENQLGGVLGTFPATFCSGDGIWNYFHRRPAVERFRNTMCRIDFANVTREWDREFLDYPGNPWEMRNRTMMTHLSGMLESGGCIVDTAFVIRWERIFNAEMIGPLFGAARRFEAALEDPFEL